MIHELLKGQITTMFSIVAVAGQFAEGLVKKGALTVPEAQGILAAIAEELRRDGENDSGKYASPCFQIANELDERAISLSPV